MSYFAEANPAVTVDRHDDDACPMPAVGYRSGLRSRGRVIRGR
ncbi:MAG: hypothetical protein JWL67_671 [Solirubrobacterales bacterium]|nr:hypothetical protein [Solirubrobacterales bacterium]